MSKIINNNVLSWQSNDLIIDCLDVSTVIDIPTAWLEFACVYCLKVERKQRYYTDHNGKQVNYNQILSYNLGILDTRKGLYCEKVIYPNIDKNGKEVRLRFKELLSIVVKAYAKMSNLTRRDLASISVLQVTHNGILEWSAFADRNQIVKNKHCIQGLPFYNFPLSKTDKKTGVSVLWTNKHYIKVGFEMSDVMCHVPKNQSKFENLSKLTKAKYLKLTTEEISNLDLLLQDNEKIYNKFVFSKIRIILEYETIFLNTANSILGIPSLPTTVASLAETYFVNKYNDLNISKTNNTKSLVAIKGFCGYKKIESTNSKGHITSSYIPIVNDQRINDFINSSYMGGLNCSYISSIYEAGKHNMICVDIDLSSAYTMALSAFKDIAWDSGVMEHYCDTLYSSIDNLPFKKRFENDSLPHSFANISFNWDPATKFPSLPVRVDDLSGIFYPLEGETVCTGIELYNALKTGNVEVRIKDIYFFENSEENTIKEIMSQLLFERNSYPIDSSMNLLYKEIATHVYGKMAQGIREKETTDINGKQNKMPRSKITSAAYASSATGFIRALLITLINILESNGCKVINVVTDGILVAVPRKEGLKIAVDDNGIVVLPSISEVIDQRIIAEIENTYPINQFVKTYKSIDKDNIKEWLTVKHVGDVVGSYKSKVSCIFYNKIEQGKSAAGLSIKTGAKIRDIFEADILSELTRDRTAGVNNIVKGERLDYVTYLTKYKPNISPDIKRIYSESGLESLPYKNISDIRDANISVIKRKKKGKITDSGTLKTQQLLKGKKQLGKVHLVSDKKKGLNEVQNLCKRMVLRAIAKREGCFKDLLLVFKTDAEIAKLLGKKDLKNEKRARFIQGLVPDYVSTRNIIDEICKKLSIEPNEDIYKMILCQ